MYFYFEKEVLVLAGCNLEKRKRIWTSISRHISHVFGVEEHSDFVDVLGGRTVTELQLVSVFFPQQTLRRGFKNIRL